MNRLDIPKGTKYGMLTVICDAPNRRILSGQIKRYVKCLCECGNIKEFYLSDLIRRTPKSCGCKYRTRNGEYDSYTYNIWMGIISRCKSHHKYRKNYFEKGIDVCDEWKNDYIAFRDWADNNGIRKGLDIDRSDNSKGYSPDNCRFVERYINCNNKDNTFYVEYKGVKYALKLLLRKLDRLKDYYTVYNRIHRYKWSVTDAIDKPIITNI